MRTPTDRLSRHRFQLASPDLVHWPAGHALTCGERGRQLGRDGDALTCFRCLENVAQEGRQVQRARTLRPRHAPPRPSAYRIARGEEQHEKTDGFRVASAPRELGKRARKGLYFIFRSDGRGQVDIVVRPAGNAWTTDDADTAEVLARHLNDLSEKEIRSKRPSTVRQAEKARRAKRK